MSEDARVVASILAITAMFFVMVAVVVQTFSNYQCKKYEDVTGRETKYVWFAGCYIDSGNGWLTDEEYKAVLVAREGLRSR